MKANIEVDPTGTLAEFYFFKTLQLMRVTS